MTASGKKVALITGITGQDGSYLAEFLLSKGYQVNGIIRRSSSFNTSRINHIYQDPHEKDYNFKLWYGDLSDLNSLIRILAEILPDEIYNLGAQSHVRVSFDIPEYTADVDALGALRLLEAIKSLGLECKFYQGSSSEMFGATPPPQNEKSQFAPRSPYAVSKVFAHQIAINYREAYGIFACCGILFNHECVTESTPVIIRKNGLINIAAIEEIVPHRTNPRHGIKYSTIYDGGLEVWDGNEWTKVKTMTATWNKAGSKNDKKIKKVICRGGYYEATTDHISFYDDDIPVKTGSLKVGDKLALKNFPSFTEKTIMTDIEAEFLGTMTADGYISREGKGRFINNNNALRERIAMIWTQIAGGYARESEHPSGFNKERNVKSIELFGNRDYLRMIRKEIYNKNSFKKVPVRIINGTKNIIYSFLKGYNACDGLKGGHQKTEFKSFTTNSQILALGLWYLVSQGLGLRITLHPEFRKDKTYFHLNINSDNKTSKGKHLQRELAEIKSIKNHDYTGWLFDFETESGTFSAGIGLTWVHNSPRRGETFVTRKITRSIAKILAEKQDKLFLGNLDAKRDWGYAPEYVQAMWLMMREKTPDDYVIATGETHSVKEFVAETFGLVGLDWKKYVEIDPKYFRPTEVENLCGDASKAKQKLGFSPRVRFKDLARLMLIEDMKANGVDPAKYGLENRHPLTCDFIKDVP